MLFFATENNGDRNKRALLAFVLGALAVGALGSVVTTPNIESWYALLAKPDFTPPDYVFAPVWTLLYGLMAVGAWRVWRIAGIRSVALTLYFIQLGLNLIWSLIFFGLHRIGPALAELGVLFAAVAATGFQFRRHDRIGGLLFIPVVAWTGFAFALNYEIWLLNP